MDWFLYDNGLRHEKLNDFNKPLTTPPSFFFKSAHITRPLREHDQLFSAQQNIDAWLLWNMHNIRIICNCTLICLYICFGRRNYYNIAQQMLYLMPLCK